MQGMDAMKYIVRKIDEDLIAWKRSEKHKPLLLRGARQVGKSSAVRHFSLQFEHFLEINFEMQPTLCKIFEQDLDAHRICDELSAITGQPIEVKAGQRGSMQSLHLFLEEKNLPYGIRTSLENRAQMEKIKIVPLYEIGRIVE